MKYLDEGKGEPIVLLHGIPSSGWSYRKMIAPLVKSGFRVIVPDMLGCGASDNPVGEGLFTPKAHAKRLNELMRDLKINRWSQVVHDAGSLWTRALLQKNPHALKKLIILNAYLLPQGVKWRNRTGTGFLAKVNLALNKIGFKQHTFATKMLKSSLDKKPEKSVMKGYDAPLEAGKTAAIFAHESMIVKWMIEKRPSLDWLPDDIMIVWGQEDEVLLWDSQSESVQDMTSIESENIHLLNAGHFIQEEKPDTLVMLMEQFMEIR